MESKSVYVELEASSELRKNILEDASESLRLVKELEEHINKLEKEEELYKKYKNKIMQIKNATCKFEGLLPIVEEHAIVKKKINKKIVSVHKKAEPKSEMDILKDEIDDIENKLKAL